MGQGHGIRCVVRVHGVVVWVPDSGIMVENVLRNEVYVTETVTRDSFWCHGLKFGVTRLIV